MNRKSAGKRIQSIERATDILNLFLNRSGPLGITDFSQLLDLPKTTIQGLVQTLEARNFLERKPLQSKYHLGPALFQLGLKYATNMDLVSTVGVWMERLCYQFQIPVNVGMLVGEKIVIVFRAEPEKASMAFPQVGTVIPMHTTAIGKSILAFSESSLRSRIISGLEFITLTRYSICSVSELNQNLTAVCSEGISYDNQENVEGLAGIGAPIRNHTNQVIAGFAVSGAVQKIDNKRAEIIKAVGYTARKVSLQLGASE